MLQICPDENDPNFQKEIWVPITFEIFNGIEPGYYVSNWGRIYNSNNFTMYPTESVNREWYTFVGFETLDGRRVQVLIHRFVSYVFNYTDNWRELEVNHKDGIKYHNWIWNLEWVTHKENMIHANTSGLCKIGEDHGNSVVTNEQIKKICELISKGLSPQEIQNILQSELPNIDISSIVDSVKNGYAWKQISSKYDFSNMYHRSFRFTENEIRSICEVFQNYGRDTSYKKVLELIGIDISSIDPKDLQTINACICNLRKRKYFKSITKDYIY